MKTETKRCFPSVQLLLLTMLLLFGLPLLAGCTPPWEIPKDKYIFIETWTTHTITVLEGDYRPVSHVDIFPSYCYYSRLGRPHDRILRATTRTPEHARLAEDRSFRAIHGVGSNLVAGVRHPGDGGISLFGVYKLPYKTASVAHRAGVLEAKTLEILALGGEGIVRIRYKGKRIVLKPGQERELSFSREIRRGNNGVLFEETIVTVIRNFGLWEKRKIQFDYDYIVAVCY